MPTAHLHAWQDGDCRECVPGIYPVSFPQTSCRSPLDELRLTKCAPRIIHFILFVFACIATHKWRKASKRSAAERRNIELQYHRSPEEHLSQQPPAYTPSAQGSIRTPTSAVSEHENPFKDGRDLPAEGADVNPFRDENAVKYA